MPEKGDVSTRHFALIGAFAPQEILVTISSSPDKLFISRLRDLIHSAWFSEANKAGKFNARSIRDATNIMAIGFEIRVANRPSVFIYMPHVIYFLPDGTFYEASPALSWCLHCRDFVPAETFRSISEIETLIQRLEQSSVGEQFSIHCGTAASSKITAIQNLRKEKSFLRLRRASPCCVQCGQSDIEWSLTMIDFSGNSGSLPDGTEFTAIPLFASIDSENLTVLNEQGVFLGSIKRRNTSGRILTEIYSDSDLRAVLTNAGIIA